MDSQPNTVPAKKTKVTKTPKVPKVVDPNAPKKPRVSRAKKQPTKEEVIQELNEDAAKAKQDLENLKEDQGRIAGMQFKILNEILDDEIKACEEELEQIAEELKHVEASEEPLA